MEFHFHIANLHIHLPAGSPAPDLSTQIKKLGETIMANLDAVTKALADAKTSDEALMARVTAILSADQTHAAEQKAQIDALQKQVADLQAANNGIDPALLDPIVAGLTELTAKNDAFAASAAPVPVPAVDPPLVP